MRKEAPLWYRITATVTALTLAVAACKPYEPERGDPNLEPLGTNTQFDPRLRTPSPVVRVTGTTTRQPETPTPPPATKTPIPTEAAACVVAPEAVLFTDGISNQTKTVPVMTEEGFESFYGTGTAADAVKLGMLNQMGFELSRIAESNQENVQRIVSPSFVTPAELASSIEGYIGSVELPFTIEQFEPGTDYDVEGTHLLTVQAGNNWTVAFWSGGNVVQRSDEDASFTVNGLLEGIREDEEGNVILVTIPAQRIGNNAADVASVENCEPTIVLVGGGPGGTTVNAVFDPQAFADGSIDPWVKNPEVADLPPTQEDGVIAESHISNQIFADVMEYSELQDKIGNGPFFEDPTAEYRLVLTQGSISAYQFSRESGQLRLLVKYVTRDGVATISPTGVVLDNATVNPSYVEVSKMTEADVERVSAWFDNYFSELANGRIPDSSLVFVAFENQASADKCNEEYDAFGIGFRLAYCRYSADSEGITRAQAKTQLADSIGQVTYEDATMFTGNETVFEAGQNLNVWAALPKPETP